MPVLCRHGQLSGAREEPLRTAAYSMIALVGLATQPLIILHAGLSYSPVRSHERALTTRSTLVLAQQLL